MRLSIYAVVAMTLVFGATSLGAAPFGAFSDWDARQAFVEELWTHGDIVGFVSEQRGVAMLVAGSEEVVFSQNPDVDWSILAIQIVATSNDLAFLVADIEPMPGDKQTFVHAQCQQRASPCDPNCVAAGTGSKKEEPVLFLVYGVCERIPEVSTSCTQTYKKVCTKKTYSKPACKGTVSSSDINAWNCK
jgi:hypothetical protein